MRSSRSSAKFWDFLGSPFLVILLFIIFVTILYSQSQQMIPTQKYFHRVFPIPLESKTSHEQLITNANDDDDASLNDIIERDDKPEATKSLEQKQTVKSEEVEKSAVSAHVSIDGLFNAPKEFTAADIWVNGHNLTINFPERLANKNEPFTVHLVLHSHIDPGWLRTFEEYYNEKVKTIIDGAVAALTTYKELRFIWSEMSFLERWWRDATSEQKAQFKTLLEKGRLELCGGGWVMTDEATPHFYSTIDNMVEGQTLIHSLFNATPITSWSVDPFGHGLLMPLLNSLSGIQNMVVGRLNDELKKTLRSRHLLQWKWSQVYGKPPNVPFVHTLPFLYYTTRNACGPDEQICCQGQVGPSVNYFACPGGIDRFIRHNNTFELVKYAKNLVDQWKITREIYGLSNILIPIGDDFYLSDRRDWDVVASSWFTLIRIINEGNFNVKAQFSTVTQYFNSLQKSENIPNLSGDFFPYLERLSSPNKYWTGFFTHRPYHKRTERVLMDQLRVLDAMKIALKNSQNLASLQESRRNLALFQHHDGITGTSKPHVMEDYLQRMKNASRSIVHEQKQLIAGIYEIGVEQISSTTKQSENKDVFQPSLNAIRLSERKKLLVFNQHPAIRLHRVSLLVDSPKASVLSADNKPITAQVALSLAAEAGPLYELSFFAEVQPLGFTEFYIEQGSEAIASPVRTVTKKPPVNGSNIAPPETHNIKSEYGNAELEFMDRIIIKNPSSVLNSLEIRFVTFDDHGGAYVFEGDEIQKELKFDGTLVCTDGPISTQCLTFFSNGDTAVKALIKILHSANIEKNYFDETVEIEVFPISADRTSVFMLLQSTINNVEKSTTDFATDINAMYMFNRKFNHTLPLAANVFPTPTAGFIQDNEYRMTVLTAQPCGMVSKEKGELLVHVDRQLSTQDGKGLSVQDALDNHRSHVKYRVLFERQDVQISESSHSINGQLLLDTLLGPSASFVLESSSTTKFKSSEYSWSCAVEIAASRYLTEKKLLVVLRRRAFTKMHQSKTTQCTYDKLNGSWEWISSLGKSLRHSSLTGTHLKEEASWDSFSQSLSNAFDISAFVITL